MRSDWRERWLGLKKIVLGFLFCVTAAITAPAAELATIKNAANGVTIAVTPNLKAGMGPEFKVVMDTHSQDLSDDLLKNAVLLDSAGNRYAPTVWDGAGPGGHHREGVLRFPPLSATSLIELQITRFREQSPRSFRWQLQ
jgi:hypothetical protein